MPVRQVAFLKDVNIFNARTLDNIKWNYLSASFRPFKTPHGNPQFRLQIAPDEVIFATTHQIADTNHLHAPMTLCQKIQ